MLEAFVQFLTYMLVAITVENAVLSRSLGSSRLFQGFGRPGVVGGKRNYRKFSVNMDTFLLF